METVRSGDQFSYVVFPGVFYQSDQFQTLFLQIYFWSISKYGITPLIQINLDGKRSKYAKNLDNWTFL